MQTRLIPSQNFYAKPFLKWAGGKRQLLNEIKNNLPKDIIGKDDNGNEIELKQYFEPFVGGGSVFFCLKNNYKIKKSVISDINPELMLTYKCIQKKPELLKHYLKKLKNTYSDKRTWAKKKKYFYDIRDCFNNNLHEINLKKINDEEIKRAAQMIFLNKTCFNGLYRVNKEGKFNVPIGNYKNPSIYDSDNIDEIHKLLNDNVIIKIQDYLNIEKYVKKDSFVYLDPPYRPVSKTSSFTDYYKDGFDENDQINLCKFIQRLKNNGAKVMLSNSKTDDGFFEKHYSTSNIYPVKARRYINSNAEKRKEIDELIITNY